MPDEVSSKKLLSQFKTETNVSKLPKQLQAQVLEKILESEMDAYWDYDKNSVAGINTDNSPNGTYSKKIQTKHRESVISIPRDRTASLNR